MAVPVDAEESLAAKFAALFPHLDERQRRLVMGAEARVLGHGGIKVVAAAADVSAVTVSRGVAELEGGGEPLGRARRPGGGRKRVAGTDARLKAALLALVDPESRGDPESPLRWTTKSTRHLAAALTAAGHPVSAPTVAALLKEESFSLQGNVKTLEGARHADRDAQFRYINAQARDHMDAGDPVISVDAKKKENVGPFKKGGAEWQPKGAPEPVNVHDFIDKELGKVTPYGVYDVAGNAGWVSVGTDHDTAAFAVATIATWWDKAGQAAYPGARRLLITADGGGSNGYRTRLWKTELAAFAAETGLQITVCHLPPGTSKWNKIEHRLFSHISMNWRGRPLTSHEVIVNTIAATTTRTGLTVSAELDTGDYPKDIKISDREIQNLEKQNVLRRHDFHGEWNYCLDPPLPPPETSVLFICGRLAARSPGWKGDPPGHGDRRGLRPQCDAKDPLQRTSGSGPSSRKHPQESHRDGNSPPRKDWQQSGRKLAWTSIKAGAKHGGRGVQIGLVLACGRARYRFQCSQPSRCRAGRSASSSPSIAVSWRASSSAPGSSSGEGSCATAASSSLVRIAVINCSRNAIRASRLMHRLSAISEAQWMTSSTLAAAQELEEPLSRMEEIELSWEAADISGTAQRI